MVGVAVLHYLSPDQVCGTLLGESCAKTYDPDSDWNITFPAIPKPPVIPVNPPQVRGYVHVVRGGGAVGSPLSFPPIILEHYIPAIGATSTQ